MTFNAVIREQDAWFQWLRVAIQKTVVWNDRFTPLGSLFLIGT